MILTLLVALGCVLIAEGVLVVEPTRRVSNGLIPTIRIAAVCGMGDCLVSSLLWVAGGELIIPIFNLLFGVEVIVARSVAMPMGMQTIAVGLIRHCHSGSVLCEHTV